MLKEGWFLVKLKREDFVDGKKKTLKKQVLLWAVGFGDAENGAMLVQQKENEALDPDVRKNWDIDNVVFQQAKELIDEDLEVDHEKYYLIKVEHDNIDDEGPDKKVTPFFVLALDIEEACRKGLEWFSKTAYPEVVAAQRTEITEHFKVRDLKEELIDQL